MVLLLLVAPAFAEGTTVDAPFADGMVIQRGKPIPIRGKAPGADWVEVRFAGQKKRSRVDGDSRYAVTLDPVKTVRNGRLVISADSGEVIVIGDVLVGDVWFCSGQSNMAWSVSRSRDSAKEIADADLPALRLATVPHRPSLVPADIASVRWNVCTPRTVPGFSAVAYYFGRELQRKVRVPIGLVNSSWGGTPAEAWTRAEALTDDVLRQRHRAMGTDGKAKPKSPSTLWNGMVAALTPFPVRGVIWYQGESNASRAEQYRTLFPAMILDWRERWGQETLPFLFVQLANYGRDPEGARGSTWAELRDAQLHTLRSVPHTGMAVTIDIGNPKNIHPANKQDVGKRLALWALATAYGKKVAHSGPLPKSHQTEGGKIIVLFDHVNRGLRLRPGLDGKTGFTIAGTDRVFRPARARIVGRSVTVWHPEIAEPAAVRYAWANSPLATLFNREGLPASPFRTDDWPGVTAGKR